MSDLYLHLRLEGSRYGGIGVLDVDRNRGKRDTQPTFLAQQIPLARP